MANGLFRGEFTPELNQARYEGLAGRIRKRRGQAEASAQSEAIRRGLAGSSFESGLRGQAVEEEGRELGELDLSLALEEAEKGRQERLLKEGREYETGEAEKGRQFEAGQRAVERESRSAELERERQFSKDQDISGAGLEFAGRSLADLLFPGGGGGGRGFEGGALGLGGGGGIGLNTPLASLPLLLKGGLLKGGALTAGGLKGATVGSSLAGLGLGYGGTRLARSIGLTGSEASRATSRGRKAGDVAGTVLGTALLGPAGGLIGGVAGGKIGTEVTRAAESVGKVFKKLCFMADTLIEMADGSLRPISLVNLGEQTKGGKVLSIRVSIVEGDIYDYAGVHLTGSHAVNEDGTWKRVAESRRAIPIPDLRGLVFSLITENHRIYVNGIEFADEAETDDFGDLDFKESIEVLNAQSSFENGRSPHG